MRLRTHVLASPFFLLFSSLIRGVPPEAAAFPIAAVGAVLPEVDKPDSLVGRLLPFSSWVHERFGHRGLTHSLLGLALAAALAAPLALASFSWWLAFVIGYLSHLLLDMATLEGVPLLWPKRTRHVFPGRDDLRLDQAAPGAGRKELILAATLLVLALALWPLTEVGLTGAMRQALGTLPETLPEYRKLADQYEVFLTGTVQDQQTGLRLSGEWPIVGVYGEGYVIAVDDHLRLVAENTGSLFPIRVGLRKGKPIRVVAAELREFSGSLRRLLSYLDPQVEHYVSGTLRLKRPVTLSFPPTAFPTLRGSESLILTYARFQDLLAIADAEAETGAVTIVHRLREGEALALSPVPPPEETAAVEFRFRVASLSELLVEEGDVVEEGQLLGRDSSPELLQKRAEVALAYERFTAGLLPEVELRKLEAELALLEQEHEIQARIPGKIVSLQILSVTPEGVDVNLRIVPKLPPRSQTRLPEALSLFRELPELPKNAGEPAQVLRAIDGDTIELSYQNATKSARLVGVDTPETKDPRKPLECFGPEAARFTSTTLPRGSEVRITYNPLGDRVDKYGRLLVYLWAQLDDDEPLELFNAALIRLGYARVYPFFKFDRLQEFRKLEEQACAEKAGLWGACGYEPYK